MRCVLLGCYAAQIDSLLPKFGQHIGTIFDGQAVQEDGLLDRR